MVCHGGQETGRIEDLALGIICSDVYRYLVKVSSASPNSTTWLGTKHSTVSLSEELVMCKS